MFKLLKILIIFTSKNQRKSLSLILQLIYRKEGSSPVKEAASYGWGSLLLSLVAVTG